MQAEPKRAAAKRVTQPALPATTATASATATLTATATHAWQPRLRNPSPTWSLSLSLTRSRSWSWSQSCSLSSSLTSSLRTAYVSAVLHLPLVRCTLHVAHCKLPVARCLLPISFCIFNFVAFPSSAAAAAAAAAGGLFLCPSSPLSLPPCLAMLMPHATVQSQRSCCALCVNYLMRPRIKCQFAPWGVNTNEL